jgi:hypothetical protein
MEINNIFHLQTFKKTFTLLNGGAMSAACALQKPRAGSEAPGFNDRKIKHHIFSCVKAYLHLLQQKIEKNRALFKRCYSRGCRIFGFPETARVRKPVSARVTATSLDERRKTNNGTGIVAITDRL